MRQGYTRIGRTPGCRSNPGHDLKGYPFVCQCFDLFATAPKDKGITTLETQYTLTLLRQPDQQLIDTLLGKRVLVACLASIDHFGITPHHVENRFGHQPVINHYISLLHQAQRPEGNQIGIAGARTHQIDFTGALVVRISILNGFLQCSMRFFLMTGEQQLCDAPLQNILPEVAPLPRIGETLLDAVTILVNQMREPTIGGWNKTFEARPQQAGKHG